MREQLPALIVIIPLSVAALAPFIAFLSVRLVRLVAIGAIFASLLCSVLALIRALSEGQWSYWFGRWEPPWGIEYVVDPLSAGMAVLITFFALVVAFYTIPFFSHDTSGLRKGMILSLYLLIVAGLTGIVLTGDLFNLFVFIEISALATYALVAIGGPKAAVSSFYYILAGTVGASLYLLGVGYLYAMTGSLNMAVLSETIQSLENSPAVITALVLIAVGMALKMGLFPMHGWLPNVYVYAPPPLTALLSSVNAKVFAYVFLRLFFFTFGAEYGAIPAIRTALGIVSAVGIIVASVIAIGQNDFRRMLAYSSVVQMCLIVLGLSIGNAIAILGALLHIVNHAFMKCCLFFVAGGIQWKTGDGIKWQTGASGLHLFAGMNKSMPLSAYALIIAAISMIGLPPAAGFFSKWYMMQGAVLEGQWHYVVVIVAGSLLTAVYFFKVIEYIFLKEPDSDIYKEIKGKMFFKELPAAILIPIIVTGVSVLLCAAFNEPIATGVLRYALPGGGL